MTSSLTYIGTLDDRVEAFPWPGIRINARYLLQALARQVLFGDRIILNNGYLIQHSLGRAAIAGGNANPLRALMEEGFVAVASSRPDIGDDLEARAPNVTTIKKVIDDATSWRKTRRVLDGLSERLNARGLIIGWGRRDQGAGLARMILRGKGRPPAEIGLAGLPPHAVAEVFERFEASATESTRGVRTQWEQHVVTAADRLFFKRRIFQRRMMGFANEAYHFNFACCLGEGRDEAVGVETRLSSAFDELVDIPAVDLERLRDLPRLDVPSDAAFFDASRLRDFANKGSYAQQAKSDFLAAQSAYLDGGLDAKDVSEAYDQYIAFIVEHFRDVVNVRNRTGHMVSLFITAATTVAGLADPTAGVAAAAIGYITDGYVAPHVMKKLRLRALSDELRAPMKRWRRGDASDGITPRPAIASVVLDKPKVDALVSDLPVFG